MRARTILLALMTVACRREIPPQPAVLLINPEVAATGIAEELVSAFQRQTSRPVGIRIVTDEQIARARPGSAAMYTDPDLLEVTRLRATVSFHDRFIVGPPGDPAKVGSATTAAQAVSRIASRNQIFCGAVDVPELQSAEREIWSTARINVRTLRRYRRCRGDAEEALRAAARMSAYTLADRVTVERVATKRLRVLLREKPMLHDTYVVALLQSDKKTFSRDAEWFVQWLMSYRGRQTLLEIQRKRLPSLTVQGQH